jgi:uncharacterized protein (TIGR02001 family)
MRIIVYLGIAAALTLGAAGAAKAESAPAVGKTRPCDGTFVSVSGVSDYRFDGFSESNRGPTWQVLAYCYRTSGVFAGTQITGVDFEDSPRTPIEVDLYLGRRVNWRGSSVTFTLMYSAFPGKRAPGPSYDIIEPQVEIARKFGRLTLNGAGGWEGDVSGRGQEWRLRGGGSLALIPWLSVGGHIGGFVGASGADHDHAFYDVGATASWKRISLDLRYGGSSLALKDCYYSHWCEAGLYGGVTWRVAP